MSRPTLEQLAELREPIAANDMPDGIEKVTIFSGRYEVASQGAEEVVLAGRWALVAKRKFGPARFWRRRDIAWQWSVAGKASGWSRQELERMPNWDGISDGDPITKGHVQALIEGGWLKA